MIAVRRVLAVGAFVATAVLSACGNDAPNVPRVTTLNSESSVQKVLDAAGPGDVVVLSAGTYSQSLIIARPDVTVRGVDRNAVIIDCEHKRPMGIVAEADGATVENLTVRNCQVNGLMFTGRSSADDTTPLDGFAARFVTTYNSGLYGIYAFQSVNGTISDSYASGHPDSGIYVGQCNPCNVVVDHVTAEYNAVGFEGTNASQLSVIRSTFSRNRVGITPNSQNLEKLAPQGSANVIGNIVADNDSSEAPEQASGAFGFGIAIGGGNANRIERNLVTGNPNAGIVVTRLDDFTPSNNRISDNVARTNGIDLAFWLTGGATGTGGNCFVDNTFDTTSPPSIETGMSCLTGLDRAGNPRHGNSAGDVDAPVPTLVPSPRFTGASPVPSNQTNQPGDPLRPAEPATLEAVDLASIPAPTAP